MRVVVTWQHKYFLPLAFSLAFVFPALLTNLLWKDPLGGLLYGGFVLRLLIWHAVFSINSLAHYLGDQEYSLENSSRGNTLLAFLTCGEGTPLAMQIGIIEGIRTSQLSSRISV